MSKMQDVAALAGVSMMTVSRVLSGQGKVRQTTKDKVEAAIKELNYKPNLSARSLASDRSLYLGLFSVVPNSAYLGQILMGVLSEGRKLGYHIVVDSPLGSPKDWPSEVVEFYETSKLGGVILPPPLCDDKAVLDALQAIDAHVVRISAGDSDPRAVTVRIHDYQAAYDMTKYLIGSGHKDIGFMMGARDQISSHARFDGFKDALSDANLTLNNAWVDGGDFNFPAALRAAQAILKDPRSRPTAIFASNDDMAAAAYAAASQCGLRIPEDISITGFDDTPHAASMIPPLTTVRQPITEMATKAVDLLAGKKAKGDSHDNMFDVEIIKRSSVQTA